jgi:chromosome partitioning protein
MNALVLAVANRKGGVPKTSLVKDLGHALAELGLGVLQIGLDPQASLEVLAGLGFDTPPDRSVCRLLTPEEFPDAGPLEAVVRDTAWQTLLVPACTGLASVERALGDPGRGGATQRLKCALERLELADAVDIVLIDCPPGMTPLTMNALVAADALLVPTQLDFLSVADLAVLMDTVEEVREYDNRALRYLGLVATMVDERTRHARDTRAQLDELFGADGSGVPCRTAIRRSTRVRDAHAARLAIGQFDPGHPVSGDYRELAREVAARAQLIAPAGAVT